MQALSPKKVIFKNPCYDAAIMQRGRKPKTEAPAFARRLVALRQEKGLTQYDLAEKLGISRNRLVYYERRCANPSMEFVQQLATALNITVETLLDKEKLGAVETEKHPSPRVKKLTDRLTRLPRNKQGVVLEMLESFLDKNEAQ